MDDSHRQVSPPLDPRMRVDQMELVPLDPDRRFPRLELDDPSGGEREDRADQEEGPHRTQASANEGRACGQPHDAEG